MDHVIWIAGEYKGSYALLCSHKYKFEISLEKCKKEESQDIYPLALRTACTAVVGRLTVCSSDHSFVVEFQRIVPQGRGRRYAEIFTSLALTIVVL